MSLGFPFPLAGRGGGDGWDLVCVLAGLGRTVPKGRRGVLQRRANARTTFYPWRAMPPPDAACARGAWLTLQLPTRPILRSAAARRPGGYRGRVDLEALACSPAGRQMGVQAGMGLSEAPAGISPCCT